MKKYLDLIVRAFLLSSVLVGNSFCISPSSSTNEDDEIKKEEQLGELKILKRLLEDVLLKTTLSSVSFNELEEYVDQEDNTISKEIMNKANGASSTTSSPAYTKSQLLNALRDTIERRLQLRLARQLPMKNCYIDDENNIKDMDAVISALQAILTDDLNSKDDLSNKDWKKVDELMAEIVKNDKCTKCGYRCFLPSIKWLFPCMKKQIDRNVALAIYEECIIYTFNKRHMKKIN
jgi:hypothetical protein